MVLHDSVALFKRLFSCSVLAGALIHENLMKHSDIMHLVDSRKLARL